MRIWFNFIMLTLIMIGSYQLIVWLLLFVGYPNKRCETADDG